MALSRKEKSLRTLSAKKTADEMLEVEDSRPLLFLVLFFQCDLLKSCFDSAQNPFRETSAS